MKKAIQFGAGNIGRGFLGQLFNQSGYKVVFIDVNKDLVLGLNKRRSYPIKIVSNKNCRQVTVRDVSAVHTDNKGKIAEEIAGAEIMATAVGKRALKSVAPLIASGIEERIQLGIKKPLNIIICENLFHGARTLRGYILEQLDEKYKDYVRHYLGLVESVVSRMVPGRPDAMKNKDPLLLIAEKYAFLPVDKNGFADNVPKIRGMQPCNNIIARQEQKMYTHNSGHSLCAYLGYLKGYKYIYEAIQDRQIKDIVLKALGESGQALIKKHRINAQEHQNYIENLLERFNNTALGDTVARGAKDPIRKLGPEDRLVGAAKLAAKFGIKPDCLALGIAAAFYYDNPKDEQAVRLSKIKKKGVDKMLNDICNLAPKEKMSLLVKEKISQIEKIKNLGTEA